MSAGTEPLPDPIELARGLRDKFLAAAGTVADVVTASEPFGETMAKTMHASASITASLRSIAHSGTEMAAAWFNLPTRRQLVELATRVNHIELVLDDLDMAAAELLERLNAGEGGD